jgi:hypothetical protein
MSIAESYSELRTQKDRLAFVRAAIDALPFARFSDSPEAEFLLRHLFGKHDAVAIGRFANPTFPADPRHLVVREADGTLSRPSWRKQIIAVDNFTLACRNTFGAICAWIDGRPCVDCGAPAEDRDHVSPQFREIIEAVRAAFPVECPMREGRPGDGAELDGPARKLFIDLHRSAVIHFVCKSCHRARTRARRAVIGDGG